jgi:hypothetical protein
MTASIVPNKKPKKETEDILIEMALQKSLEDIKKQSTDMVTKEYIKNQLENMVTKEDIKSLKEDMNKVVANLTNRMDKLESDVFDPHTQKDKLGAEVVKLRGENMELKGQLEQRSKESNIIKQAQNDNEQHGRQWNIRVYGIAEATTDEPVSVCIKMCVSVIKEKVGVEVTEKDIELAHRTGKRGGARPRPIIARFFSRQVRGEVLTNRRKLKQSGISIGEDLTQANYNLLKAATAHSATLAAWSTHGKILVKLKNGKLLKLDIGINVNDKLSREM